jgi:cAMP-binding proteins - catabolite gene activator and regulatory subunit of cAMP-dependent protein kinases
MQDIIPYQLIDAFLITVICLVFQHLVAMMIGDVAAIMSMKNYTKNIYEVKVEELVCYAKDVDLSQSLQDKVRNYFAALWHYEKGEMFPAFIYESPTSLQQVLKYDMYGHHMYGHHLLSGLHIDLLRQMTGKLERCIYFPENIIVETGDIDDSMYFIHDGEVEVVEKDKYMETVIDILLPTESFGIMQKCIKGKPHVNMYRARTTVELLILRRNSWIHFLDFFPKSEMLLK